MNLSPKRLAASAQGITVLIGDDGIWPWRVTGEGRSVTSSDLKRMAKSFVTKLAALDWTEGEHERLERRVGGRRGTRSPRTTAPEPLEITEVTPSTIYWHDEFRSEKPSLMVYGVIEKLGLSF